MFEERPDGNHDDSSTEDIIDIAQFIPICWRSTNEKAIFKI